MEAMWSGCTKSYRSLALGTRAALLFIFALCLGAGLSSAQTTLPIVVSQGKTLGYFPGGGWSASQTPLSGTFAIGPNGDVLITDEWGGNLLDITLSGTVTKLATVSNAGPSAVDAYGNVYVTYDGYNGSIYKIPFNSSTGTYTGFTTAPTVNCLGANLDTAPCLFAPHFQSVFTNGSGYSDLVFDAAGNLFIATSTVPTDNPNTIYKCDATCQTSATGTPTKIFADPNPIGALAVDPWGNLYFSDGNNSQNKVTYLNELPLVSGSYAASPTVLESYTNKQGYGNGFSGVAIDGKGTIYFATNADGIFGIPSTQAGGPNLAGLFMVAQGGGYGITLDRQGNLYLVHYAGSPPSGSANYAVDQILVNKLPTGATTIGGTATTAAANFIDNSASCTPTLSMGVASSEFTVTPGTSCSAALGTGNGTFNPALSLSGAAMSASFSFNPGKVGERTAEFGILDTNTNAGGAAALIGVGQGGLGNVDPGVATAYTTGLSAPASVIADAVGDLFIADSGAGKVFEIVAGTSTLTSIGSGLTAPSALAFDSSRNLYIADAGVPSIVQILNSNTSGGFASRGQSTVVGSSMLFGGTALGNPAGLAVGPDGLLYIADLTNSRVVTWNPITGAPALTNGTAANGLKSPVGVALDASANLYVADDSLNEIFVFGVNGIVSTIAPSGLTQVAGVAVDPSGSVLIADKATGNIVRVPASSGTPDPTKATVIEKNPQSASSISLDALGNLYTTDSAAKSVFAIQRSAGAIDLGTIADGASGTGTVYLMNAGNQAATLANPLVTQPANTMFTLAPAATNGCTPGGTGPAGAMCAFTAQFAPPAGSNDSGPYSDTATILVSAPSQSIPVAISGTASVSALKPQTITYSPVPPAAGFIGQQITLAATATSGLAVTFTTSTPNACTVNGATATFIAAGTCTILANQAGGSNGGQNWGAAPQVTTSITITSSTPAGVPALIMSQVTWLNPTGSFTDGQTPQGGSFAVTQNGQLVLGTTYSNKVYVVDAKTGATIGTPVKVNGPGGVTVDSHNNLYISHLYNNVIYKIPFVNGAYVAWADSPTPAPPACTGTDTAQCTFVSYPSGAPNSGGIKAIAFDPSGNFYMVSEPDSANTLTGQSYIYECDTTCQPAGTAKVLYNDPNGVSQIAFDPWGNLFFTDANYNVKGANDVSNSGASASSLNELVYTSGTGFAATPTVLQTFTNNGGGGSYDDMLASVAVDSNGTIYYGVLYDGMFAMANTQSGGPQVTNQFAVSTQGAKALQAGPNGNIYLVANTSGADTVGVVAINNLAAGTGPVLGTPVTASATVVDNAFGCNTAATLAFTSSNPQFSATAGTTCSWIGMGDATLLHSIPGIGSYPMTISFGPTSGGPQSATLSASDTANGGTGTAAVSGVGQEIPQTITFTAPTTFTYTFATGLTVNLAATGGASNHPVTFTVDAASTGAGTIASNVLTVTQAGTIVIDANQPGGLVNNVYYQDATQAQMTLTINKAAQAIVFAAQSAPATYAPGLTITLSATGGASTSPVVFSVDTTSTGAGTIAGNVLTVTQAGNIVLNANQATDVNYLAAPQVQQTFVVNQASQSITFIPLAQTLHYIMGGVQVQISATGGATNNAIVFTVDAKSPVAGAFSKSTVSGSTSTATLTILDQAALASFPANIVIDATQPGNANYSDGTPASETIPLQKPLPTQAITFGNPGTQVVGTPLALTATSSSGFPVNYDASTTPTICTVDNSTSTATFIASGTCTITASQPGDNLYFAAAAPVTQTFAVNPTGQAPSLGMTLSLSNLTMQAGTVGLTQVTVNSVNNFTGSVAFSCSGAPSGYSCTFNPSTVTAFTADPKTGLPLGVTGSTQLSISGGSAAANHNSRPLLPFATLAVALCWLGFRKRNRLHLMVLLLVAAAGLGLFSGCGGSSTSSKKTSTTSSITVTATAGNTKQSSTLTLIIEQ